METEHLETLIAAMGAVDHRQVAWGDVRWTAYLVHQHLRYEYPGEIADLRQRLMIVPRERHGDQRLVTHKLEVSTPAIVQQTQDDFGNIVLDVYAERVEQAIDFTAWIVVERDATAGPIAVSPEEWADPGMRGPSVLATPDEALLWAADDFASHREDELTLARRINAWVHREMTYEHGPTGVKTSAAEAFALRRGVCQDYAHIMLALCRQCGLPARYVSGHLLGEGGTHAWVEVLLPGADGTFVAHPFDPTNDTEPGLKYITVAVGRDYRDVAPTSGTFRASYPGRLSGSKRAGVTALEYFTPPV